MSYLLLGMVLSTGAWFCLWALFQTDLPSDRVILLALLVAFLGGAAGMFRAGFKSSRLKRPE